MPLALGVKNESHDEVTEPMEREFLSIDVWFSQYTSNLSVEGCKKEAQKEVGLYLCQQQKGCHPQTAGENSAKKARNPNYGS